MSKDIVPIRLLDVMNNIASTPEEGFALLYFKEGFLTSYNFEDVELDIVLDRALTGFTTTNPTNITEDDTVLEAFQKLAENSGGGGTVLYTNPNPTPANFPSDAMPNIPIGTRFDNKTVEEVFNMMFYPELFPNLEDPSSSFSLQERGFQEIGVILTLHFSSSFDRGSIDPNYGTSGFRSGLPNIYNYTGFGLSNNPSTSLSDTQSVTGHEVIQGLQSWTGNVSYDEGEQPLSDQSNDYEYPLPAGTTPLITQFINGVYPAFSTSIDINILTKHSLQAMNADLIIYSKPGTFANNQTFDIPNAWSTITGVKQYNSISGNYETIVNWNTYFDISSIDKIINGNSVPYTRYQYNGDIGDRILKFII